MDPTSIFSVARSDKDNSYIYGCYLKKSNLIDMGKTTFILGAGSNCSMKFPLGNQLYNQAINEILIDSGSALRRILQVLKDEEFIEEDFVEFAKQLKKSDRKSIDEFTYHHPEFEQIAKIILMYFISIRENDFDLFNQEEPHWYRYIWDIINTIDFEDFPAKDIGFITFNYDRSLEQYLYTVIYYTYGSRYNLDSKRIRNQICNKIPIHHVYGKIDNLKFANENNYLDYEEVNSINNKDQGIFKTADKLIKIYRDRINNIKLIYTDRNNIDSNIDQIKDLIIDSSQLIFIGFAFNELNMEILGFKKGIPHSKYPSQIYGYDYEKNNTKKIHTALIEKIATDYNIRFNKNHHENIVDYISEEIII